MCLSQQKTHDETTIEIAEAIHLSDYILFLYGKEPAGYNQWIYVLMEAANIQLQPVQNLKCLCAPTNYKPTNNSSGVCCIQLLFQITFLQTTTR